MGTGSPLRGRKRDGHEMCLPAYHGDAREHLGGGCGECGRGCVLRSFGIPSPAAFKNILSARPAACLSSSVTTLDEHLVSSSEWAGGGEPLVPGVNAPFSKYAAGTQLGSSGPKSGGGRGGSPKSSVSRGGGGGRSKGGGSSGAGRERGKPADVPQGTPPVPPPQETKLFQVGVQASTHVV